MSYSLSMAHEDKITPHSGLSKCARGQLYNIDVNKHKAKDNGEKKTTIVFLDLQLNFLCIEIPLCVNINFTAHLQCLTESKYRYMCQYLRFLISNAKYRISSMIRTGG